MFSGKGTPRRKVKKVPKSSGSDDKKLQTALKKLNVQPIQAIEEVNMFKEDGNVIHFANPKGKYKSYIVFSFLSFTFKRQEKKRKEKKSPCIWGPE